MKNYTVVFGTGDPRGQTGLSPTFLQFWNLSSGTTNAPPSIAETVVGKTGVYTFSYGTTQPIQFLIDAATTSPGANNRYVVGQIDPSDRADEYGTTLTAIGFSNLVYGSSLYAYGTTLTAIGYSGLVYGSSLFAQGTTLTAIGFSNLVYGSSLLAQGTTLTAIGFSNLVYGSSLTAQGVSLTAQGVSLAAQSVSLMAQGVSMIAQGVTITYIGQSGGLFSLIGSPTASSFGSTSIDPTDMFGFLKRAQEMAEGNQIYTKATGVLDFYNRGSSTLLREKTISDTSANTTKS